MEAIVAARRRASGLAIADTGGLPWRRGHRRGGDDPEYAPVHHTMYLQVVNDVDTFPYHGTSHWRLVAHDNALLGYVIPATAEKLAVPELAEFFTVESGSIQMKASLASFETRNDVFRRIGEAWRQNDAALAAGWRNELYAVYNPPGEPYFLVERAVSVLLGVVTYGVHCNGYIPAEISPDRELKLWIPRRAKDKPTYPGKLDNTVAGGLGWPLGIEENLVKECYEEAGLDEQWVLARASLAGVVSYMVQPDGPKGHVQPEVEYIYDLKFDNETVPRPVDGESEDFVLMGVAEVKRRMEAREFKPNCALVVLDFLIRHGAVGPDTPGFLELVARMHRRLPFPTR